MYLWSGKLPDISYFRTFGCAAYSHVPKQPRHKWDSHTTKLRFVGYGEMTQGYKLINLANHYITYSRNVHFNETDFTTGHSSDIPSEPGSDIWDQDEQGSRTQPLQGVDTPVAAAPLSLNEPVFDPVPPTGMPDDYQQIFDEEEAYELQEVVEPRMSTRHRTPIHEWKEPPLGYNPDYNAGTSCRGNECIFWISSSS